MLTLLLLVHVTKKKKYVSWKKPETFSDRKRKYEADVKLCELHLFHEPFIDRRSYLEKTDCGITQLNKTVVLIMSSSAGNGITKFINNSLSGTFIIFKKFLDVIFMFDKNDTGSSTKTIGSNNYKSMLHEYFLCNNT